MESTRHSAGTWNQMIFVTVTAWCWPVGAHSRIQVVSFLPASAPLHLDRLPDSSLLPSPAPRSPFPRPWVRDAVAFTVHYSFLGREYRARKN